MMFSNCIATYTYLYASEHEMYEVALLTSFPRQQRLASALVVLLGRAFHEAYVDEAAAAHGSPVNHRGCPAPSQQQVMLTAAGRSAGRRCCGQRSGQRFHHNVAVQLRLQETAVAVPLH